jgi:hypothetical protein
VEAITARQHFQFVAFLIRDTTDFAYLYLFFLLLLLFLYFCPLSISGSFGGTPVGRFSAQCIFIPRPLQVCVRNACVCACSYVFTFESLSNREHLQERRRTGNTSKCVSRPELLIRLPVSTEDRLIPVPAARILRLDHTQRAAIRQLRESTALRVFFLLLKSNACTDMCVHRQFRCGWITSDKTCDEQAGHA